MTFNAWLLPNRARDADVTKNFSLLQAALLVTGGVVCLLSALRYHDLTTQAPFEVWMAIDNKAWKPTVNDVPLRIHYFTGAALTEGVEEHLLEGVPVKFIARRKQWRIVSSSATRLALMWRWKRYASISNNGCPKKTCGIMRKSVGSKM